MFPTGDRGNEFSFAEGRGRETDLLISTVDGGREHVTVSEANKDSNQTQSIV